MRVGPVALIYRVERSFRVTRNSRKRLKLASQLQHSWRHGRMARRTFETTRRHFSNPDADPAPPEVALIVGVGPGFGYALAKQLAHHGFVVSMASRNAERLDGLATEIHSDGGMAVAYGCDATNENSVKELFKHVCSQHGVPSLVVYSLQNFGPGETVDIELAAFEDGWRHNCLGSFLVAREAARAMLEAGRGTIVLTGSTSSLLGRAGHLNLAVGKFGQRALAQVLARELWPKGIHVAHLVIDADIHEGEERDDGGPQSNPHHVAQTVVALHRQPASAWTSEIDIRPSNERFWEHC